MPLLNESTGIYLNAAKSFKGEFIHTVKVRKKNGVMPQNTQCTMFKHISIQIQCYYGNDIYRIFGASYI